MPARITEPAVGASTCASGSQVCTGHIGIFTANEAKKASHSHHCMSAGNLWVSSVGMSVVLRVPVHRHHGEQHQHGAQQRVEEELEAGVDAPRAAPHADDQEHRDQAALEEQVEEDEVERAEDADHQRLQHEEGDHVLLDAVLDRLPARQDAQRHQERGEHHEQHRDAVDAHLVFDGAAEPVHLLDELEAGGCPGRSWPTGRPTRRT